MSDRDFLKDFHEFEQGQLWVHAEQRLFAREAFNAGWTAGHAAAKRDTALQELSDLGQEIFPEMYNPKEEDQ